MIKARVSILTFYPSSDIPTNLCWYAIVSSSTCERDTNCMLCIMPHRQGEWPGSSTCMEIKLGMPVRI
jgi:hypothetical protein